MFRCFHWCHSLPLSLRYLPLFRCFLEVSIQLRHFVFANFIPTTGDVIQRYIEQFVANRPK